MIETVRTQTGRVTVSVSGAIVKVEMVALGVDGLKMVQEFSAQASTVLVAAIERASSQAIWQEAHDATVQEGGAA